jgi:hypothetical protein
VSLSFPFGATTAVSAYCVFLEKHTKFMMSEHKQNRSSPAPGSHENEQFSRGDSTHSHTPSWTPTVAPTDHDGHHANIEALCDAADMAIASSGLLIRGISSKSTAAAKPVPDNDEEKRLERKMIWAERLEREGEWWKNAQRDGEKE